MRKAIFNVAAAIAAALVGFSMFGFDDPYIVDILVHDRTTTPITVVEIWSDRHHVYRPIGDNEISDYACGPNMHCTNKSAHCKVVNWPVAGATCDWCSAGTVTDSFCWSVNDGVCAQDTGTTNCGNETTQTCAVPAGGGSATCTGGTPTASGTCTLASCSS